MAIRHCVLCQDVFTAQNTTKEHIIPMSIGGRRTVRDFICRRCNNRTGRLWDSQLAKELRFFGILVGIKRQRGEVPPIEIEIEDGRRALWHSNNKMTLSKPDYKKHVNENTTQISFSARSISEMEGFLRRLVEDRPELDFQALLSNVETKEFYSQFATASLQFGGPESDRSRVKSAVSLAFDAGIDPRHCEFALGYLTKKKAELCFYRFYEQDIVLNRTDGMPLHCVHISGSPHHGILLGYVELFGVDRIIVCLSKLYEGDEIRSTYALNPITGEEQSVEIELDPTSYFSIDSQTYDQRYEVNVTGMMKTIDAVLGSAQSAAQSAEIKRLVDIGMENFLKASGKREGDIFEEEDIGLMSDCVMKSVLPFLLHIMSPLNVPWDELQGMGGYYIDRGDVNLHKI